jgi:hypothetical protein
MIRQKAEHVYSTLVGVPLPSYDSTVMATAVLPRANDRRITQDPGVSNDDGSCLIRKIEVIYCF